MSRPSKSPVLLIALLLLVLAQSTARADEVRVAVAANFASTLTTIAKLFEQATSHVLVASAGASGQLFAQISNGAPFDVFLSADAERPRELEKQGLAVKGTRFVYAEGRLVLWSAAEGRVDAHGAVLKQPDLGKVAIADPRTAPYGAAAERVLRARKLWDALSDAGKIAIGTSIGQAHQFVASGNADVGFVALSQVRAEDGKVAGSHWLVPKHEAGRIQQEAALLKLGEASAAARAFLTFLRKDPGARSAIERAGYEVARAR